MKNIRFYLLLLLTSCFYSANAQTTTADAASTDSVQGSRQRYHQIRFAGAPFIYLTPETGFAFGAGAFTTMDLKKRDTITNPSSIDLLGYYTVKAQKDLALGYDFYFDENRHSLRGKFSYKDYVESYFGTGNNTILEEEEIYKAITFSSELVYYRKFKESWYIGINHYLETERVYEVDSTYLGDIAEGTAPGLSPGWPSTLAHGAGISLNYDDRVRIFTPYRGHYIEAIYTYFGSLLGSDFAFNSLYLDARKYVRVYHEHVLAMNYTGDFNFGDPPFNLMAMLGGRGLRGIYEGRFRDKHAMTLQAEYRFPFFNPAKKIIGRLGGVVFAGVGTTAPAFTEFNFAELRPAYGGGLRFMFNRKDHVNIRFDVGLSPYNDPSFYLTLKEAF